MDGNTQATLAAAGLVAIAAVMYKAVGWMRLKEPFNWVFPADVNRQVATINFPAYELPPSILITGGCGFLGRSLIDALREQKGVERIVAFDVVTGGAKFSDPRVTVVQGDLLDAAALRGALATHKVGAVIHTASPHPNGRDKSLFHRVNVLGTEAVIAACLAVGVRTLVHTSSASVVWEGRDQAGVGEEDVGYPAVFRDPYAESKAQAEQAVMAAGKAHADKLAAVALRPHAIFGPGDRQMVPAVLDTAREGRDGALVGDGGNLVDWTFAGNVVHAHLLAVEAATRHWAARDAAVRAGVSAASLPAFPAAGKAYFITNGQPVRFWAFMNALFLGFGYPGSRWRIPVRLVYPIAWAAQAVVDVINALRPRAAPISLRLNPSRLQIITTVHYYSIEAARRDLGYAPLWDLHQGLYLTLRAFLANRNNRPSAAVVVRARACNMTGLGFVRDPDAASRLADPSTLPSFTREEVATHCHPTDLWVIVDGKVLDLSVYALAHPGGMEPLLRNAGKDASAGFHGDQHPEHVAPTAAQFVVGRLAE